MTEPQSPHLIPTWIFEQDYLVFLSFFGWMLVGLLSWTKPLSQNEGSRLPWLWIGYYAFSQATSDFLRTLSFSDPFFRNFNMEVGFEMLGYGLLVEIAIRSTRRTKSRNSFPLAALGGLFLGLSIEIGDLLYTLVVSFLVSVIAVIWAAKSLIRAAWEDKRPEIYAIVVGLAVLLPTWLLAPDRLSLLHDEPSVAYAEFPNYGFDLLLLRILAGWIILAGFWYFRLQRRIEDVAQSIGERLKLWGYRVLPTALCVIVGASYLITSWNGQRAQSEMVEDFISRAQTAALAMDAGDFADFEQRGESPRELSEALAGQLLAIKRVGTDVRSVYLWSGDAGDVRTVALDREQSGEPVVARLLPELADSAAFGLGEPFIVGPFEFGGASMFHVSSPVVDRASGRLAYWLGIDLDGSSYFENVSLTRLQSIIIAGLILALVIFFLYYQIDHESEADLVLAKERAEAADRAKSEFLAVISHEIRTPLQSVLGYSDLLRSTPLNEKQHLCLDTIQSEGKILLRIVQDILDFSNLRKANFELKEGPVSLHRLISETFRTIEPMAERKGLKASLEIDERVPKRVVADGVRLRQVLLNLFGNSVKYTEAGRVNLRAFMDTQSGPGEESLPLKFEISDTGFGIKEQDLNRLFEPFIQLDQVGKAPREGAGLGLAIVKRIIDLMGGTIQVESAYGVGSKFTVAFDFPALAEEEAAEAADRPTQSALDEEARLGKRYPMRVLVVDDNPMVRRLMLQYLESLGYEADEFEGGKPASERGHQYDLVIIDLRMPGIDGPQASSLIREKSGHAERPWIVAVSASLQEEEVKRARDSGVNDFLGKPFYAGQLAEKIREIPWFDEMETSLEEPQVDERPAESKRPEEHVPLFIGPVSVEEERAAVNELEQAHAADSVFSGIDSYPKEAVQAAIAEVYSKHDDMVSYSKNEDWAAVRDDAHYIANTAMALGIDQLYLDSKALEAAAEQKDEVKVESLLRELRLNFEAWEKDE